MIGFRWPVTTGSSLARGHILVVVQRLYLGGRTEVNGALVEVHHSSQVCHLILKVVLIILAVLEIVIGFWLPLTTRNACFEQCPGVQPMVDAGTMLNSGSASSLDHLMPSLEGQVLKELISRAKQLPQVKSWTS